MQRKFDEELNELKRNILKMSSIVNDAIEKSVEALLKKDEKLANDIEKMDDEIDKIEIEIDQMCLDLLTRYQPAAVDLRFITAIMKINNDIERIGDLATIIAHKTKIILRQHYIEIPETIKPLKDKIISMFKDAMISLIDMKYENAISICDKDKEIDEIYVNTFRNIQNYIIKNTQSIKSGIELILIIKFLERMADHITNIAEDIVYMVKGETIKHRNVIKTDKIKVLFVCIHNSARSQMAEAYLNFLAGEKFLAESAGIEPGVLNQYVVKVMKEDGIDISGNQTKSVFDFYKQEKIFSYVITVCDKEAAEKCPVFPGQAIKLHWSFPDPSSFTGTEQEILQKVRKLRDEIKNKIKEFIDDFLFSK